MAQNEDQDSNGPKPIEALASEVLANFEKIADTAFHNLGYRGATMDAMASINQATAEKIEQNFREMQRNREIDCRRLMDQPAIARLIVADDDDNREVLYVSPAGTVGPLGFSFCSYLSPKGSLASFPIGAYRPIRLPGGVRNFEVIEKATFSPQHVSGQWDSRPAVIHAENGPPTTIKSLRDLLKQQGFSDEDLDELERQLAEDDAANNVSLGLQRSVLTAMQMRVQPLLDECQSEIVRLPLSSRLAVLGPPGSGKTTTLIKRLRQKLDFAVLEPEERDLVEDPAPNGLDHAHSWLMFTPTALLKEYVKAAFAREDVPVSSERIQTWDDYRHTIARRNLPILRAGKRNGMTVRHNAGTLLPETGSDQIAWFEAFTQFHEGRFLTELADAAARLDAAKEGRTVALGRQITAAIERSRGEPALLLFELAALMDDLQELASASRKDTRQRLRSLLGALVGKDKPLLDALATFIARLAPDNDDELDDPDAEDDDDEPATAQGRRAAEGAFYKALRAKAVAEATGRAPARTSRNAHVLAWLGERGATLPRLAEIGTTILVQRALVQVARAPANYIAKIPARYRRFRREAHAEGNWYATLHGAAEVDELELDIVILAMLRTARKIAANDRLMRRFGEGAPDILGVVARLYRNQILVDEATDFSPIQLACMAAMVDPRTDSFFAIGDFNQRLTKWGTRSREELRWLFPDFDIRDMKIVYRQSRKLNEFAKQLTQAETGQDEPELPAFLENEGVSPVLGMGLTALPDLAEWLASRINEIERFSDGLPSIAVLVNREDELQPLADALNDALAEQAIRAIACPKGQAIGPENDVRIFEVQHIKGLEFEAIFFVNIDALAQAEPDLFERFIYVGATRAATFLGLTCAGDTLPAPLLPVEGLFEECW